MPLLSRTGGGKSGAKVEYAFTAQGIVGGLTTTTPLSIARNGFGRQAQVGDYALFAGGCNWNGGTNVPQSIVEAYNSSLTKNIANSLTKATFYLQAAKAGNYCLFIGGSGGSGSIADVYSSSLSMSTLSGFSSVGFHLYAWGCAMSVGNSAIFYTGQGGSIGGIIDAVNSSLTITRSTLNYGNTSSQGVSVGSYGYFDLDKKVVSTNEGLGTSLIADLTSTTICGNYGCTAFNLNGIATFLTNSGMERYNSSQTKLSTISYPTPYICQAVSTGSFAVLNTADGKAYYYDANFTLQATKTLTSIVGRIGNGGGVVGGKILLAGGGDNASTITPTVEVLTLINEIYPTIDLNLPKGSVYSFNGSAETVITEPYKRVVANLVQYGYIKYKSSKITSLS